MTRLKSFDVFEFFLIPTTAKGWFVVFLIAMGSLLLLNESRKFYVNYFDIHKWKNAPGILMNVELSPDGKMVHLDYKYKIGDADFLGNKTGIEKLEWYDASNRDINDIMAIRNKHQSIVIKYNPKNKLDSVYAYDSDDIVIVCILSLFHVSVYLLFLICLIRRWIK